MKTSAEIFGMGLIAALMLTLSYEAKGKFYRVCGDADYMAITSTHLLAGCPKVRR